MEHLGYFEVTFKYQFDGNDPIVTMRFVVGVLVALAVGAEVQADCICIVYLGVPVCVIEGGGGAR